MQKIMQPTRYPIRIVIRRYEVIITGCVLLLSGAVMPSYWDSPHQQKILAPAAASVQIHQKLEPQFVPAPPTVIRPVRAPRIALTFDDGPHPGRTERLLDVLRDAGVPGTFFVVGKMAHKYPELVSTIARQGHEIANHSYNHPNLSRLTDEEVVRELDDTRSLIKQITGKDVPFYRPPGGEYNRRIVKAASKAGYRMVLWSVLTDDVEGASPRSIRTRILRGAQDGGIILMHSGIETTVETLPSVIKTLKDRGYQFTTVSSLLKQSDGPVAPAGNKDTPLAAVN